MSFCVNNKFILLVVALLATVSLFVFAAEEAKKEPKPSDFVLELDESTIDKAFKENALVAVMFYAPWCGHSKRMQRDWEYFGESEHGRILFTRIDASAYPAVAKKYDIKHFPTIKFIRHGHVSAEYEGGRDRHSLSVWVEAMRQRAVRIFHEKEEYQDLYNRVQRPAVICVDAAESETCLTFHEAAEKTRNRSLMWLSFLKVELIEEVGLGKYKGKIILLHPVSEEIPNEERIVEINIGSGSFEDIMRDVNLKSVSIFGNLNPETFREYMNVKLPMLYLFTSANVVTPGDSADGKKPTDADKRAFEQVKAIAKEFHGKITFVHIDASNYGSLAPRVGLSGDQFPAVAIDEAGAFYAYPQGDAITSEKIRNFANEYLGGKLKRIIRSEAAPAAHTDDNGLTTVVGTTFDKLILNKEHDVFVQFYAPWCSHCKEMVPALNDLAKKLKNEDVVIARFDATANEYDKNKFQVLGFPTLYFIKAGKGGVAEEYTGGRSLDEMLTYVRQKVDQE
jgi:protein disulfide isomerase